MHAIRRYLPSIVIVSIVAVPFTPPAQAESAPVAAIDTTAVETKRRGPDQAGSQARAQAEDAGIDLGGVIETVRHHFDAAPNGAAVTEDPLYGLIADRSGFDLRLRSEDSNSGLGISLREIRVGATAQTIGAKSWLRSANTVSRQHAFGLTEMVTARDRHVEWDFVLKAPPTGDIAIHAEVSGGGRATRVTELRESADGLPVPAWRFAFGGGRGARVGEMIVVDAEGRELLRALPEIAGTELRMHVPVSLLKSATYPVTIDPVVSPEYPASDPLWGEDRANGQSEPELAWSGTNFLVVWADYISGTNYDIYGARVDPDGNLLDPGGIAIATTANHESRPSIAWSGTNFLVVWADSKSGTNDIYGVRVSADGVVVEPSAIAISTAANTQVYPSVAWNGTNFLVVWQDFRWDANDIYGTRVSVAGAVLEPAGIAISTAANAQVIPSVASDGTNFLVVWQDFRSGTNDVYGTRVSASGGVLDGAGIPISTAVRSQTLPAVAWNGTNFLVVWQDFRSGTTDDIYGSHVNGAGAVLDAAGIAISTAAGHQSVPSVASDGLHFMIVWDDTRSGTRHLYGARMSSGGAVLDAAGIAISTAAGGQSSSSIAFDGTNFLVVWQHSRPSSGLNIYGARMNSGGVVLDSSGIAISTAANNQYWPSIGWNGQDFLVVWEDARSGTNLDIYGARVSADGALLDATGIAISTAANSQFRPSVASDGTNFLVVWQDLRLGTSVDVYGARVSAAGAVLEPEGIAISTSTNTQGVPWATWDGTSFFVVWEDRRSGSTYDIYGARVNADGTVLEPNGIAISTAVNNQSSPRVVSDGTSFLVVWHDARSGTGLDIYGARVSDEGVLLDASGIAISTAANNQSLPSVAWNGETFLVVWEDYRSAPNLDIYGARVSAGGTVLEPTEIAISRAANNQSRPSVAWNDTNFVVVWYDYRSGTNDDIFGARVTADGTLLDVAGIAMTLSTSMETSVNVVAGLPDSVALAYRRTALEPPYGSDRVFVRFYDDPSNDPFANPRRIPDDTGSLEGINRGATKEDDEPSHAADPGGSSVWYEWTPEYGAPVTIDTEDSTFDTVLAVYTGSTLGDLTLVASNDDASPDLTSEVTFDAIDDTPYRIAVDGHGGATGVVRLNWTQADVTPPEVTITSGPTDYAPPSVTFTFTASEEVSFSCSLDADAFTPCDSPTSYTGLSDGTHTFVLRARNLRGNVGTTSRDFIVDSSPPEISVLRPTRGVWALDKKILAAGPVRVVVGAVTVEARALDAQSDIASSHFEINGMAVDSNEVTCSDGTCRYLFDAPATGKFSVAFCATNGAGISACASTSLLVVVVPKV